jgi:hypothetical protein
MAEGYAGAGFDLETELETAVGGGTEMSRGLLIVLSMVACAGLGCAGAGGGGSAKSNLAPYAGPRGFSPRSATVHTSQMEADLVRRERGEWVIVRMTESPEDASPPEPTTANGPREQELRATLEAYERALEERDGAALSQVWAMNPAERTTVERMFERGDRISVRISDAEIAVSGDRARIAFRQRFSLAGGPSSNRLARIYWRALAASDSVGSWALDSLSAN